MCMSAIKDGRVSITLDKERNMLFSLNVMDDIQDRYGALENLADVLNMQNPKIFAEVRWLMTALLNEGAPDGEDPLTERQVGKLLHPGNLTQIIQVIMQAFHGGISGDAPDGEGEDNDKQDEEDAKNQQAGSVA